LATLSPAPFRLPRHLRLRLVHLLVGAVAVHPPVVRPVAVAVVAVAAGGNPLTHKVC
jgi:hypothetical protein